MWPARTGLSVLSLVLLGGCGGKDPASKTPVDSDESPSSADNPKPKDAGKVREAAAEDARTDNEEEDARVPATRADASVADAAKPATQTPFDGPVDGDPDKPMVSVPGVLCGAGRAGFGAPAPTVKIGGRDVVLFYPCAHEGAAVTFLFTLHGTLQEAQKVSFTLNAGPFHTLADSHNIIYVLPKAVGTQWGREDNGTDLPHIHEVIDWVYQTFGEKFDIRSMWAQGGSWGAFYLASTLACDAKLESRLRGVRLIVGGGCPACSSRLSCIVAQQELEKGMGMMMTPAQREMVSDAAGISAYAKQHGCGDKTGPSDVGNTKYWSWPDCDPGWVHSYYLAPGQHADPWDPVAIKQTAEEMKSIE